MIQRRIVGIMNILVFVLSWTTFVKAQVVGIDDFSDTTLAATADLSSNSFRPNVLFIYTDDQAKDECNFCEEGQIRGQPRNLSPEIDSLAKSGVAFTNFYVSSAQCTPSRYSALTGTYASRSIEPRPKDEDIVSIRWNTFIRTNTPHLASVLKGAGYYTGFIGKNHAYGTGLNARDITSQIKSQEDWPLLRKFHDESVQVLKERHEYDFAGAYYDGNLSRYPKDFWVHNLDWKVKNALEFFGKARDAEKPFFLHFATTITHAPKNDGTAHLGDRRITSRGKLPTPGVTGVMPDASTIYERVDKAGISRKQADVLWLDDGVKAMTDWLKDHGMYENTVILYFNDNGNEGGKASIYEPGCNTFGFITGPGINSSGVIYDKLVQNVDLMPTILELAGVPERDWPRVMDGVSILPATNNPNVTIRNSAYVEVGFARAVVMDGFKYAAIRTPAWWNWTDGILNRGITHALELRAIIAHPKTFWDSDQLYNLETDKSEWNNLVNKKSHAARVRALKAELSKYVNSLPSSFGEF